MEQKTIYALGFFDGVHIGHQALLTACGHLAQRKGCEVGVVTFDTHPDGVVANQAPPLINTVEERRWLLAVKHFVVLPFDDKMMQTPWQTLDRKSVV